MDNTGNNASLTAAAVVVTGLIGANFAQVTMDTFGLKDPIARGMATAARFVAYLFIVIVHSILFKLSSLSLGVQLIIESSC